MYTIELYDTDAGACPVGEFLLALEPKMKAKALRMIDLLEVNGPNLRKPYSRYLDDGILELRIKLSSNIIRIFYFFAKNNVIVLTNATVKKRQKLHKGQLELAKKYKTDYERR